MGYGHTRRLRLLNLALHLLTSFEVRHVRSRNIPQSDLPRSFRSSRRPTNGYGTGPVQLRAVVAPRTTAIVSPFNHFFPQVSHFTNHIFRSCTCPGEDHPGPSPKKGRGAPEIDVFEAERNKTGAPGGIVSQSAQFAPFTRDYLFDNSTSDKYTIYNHDITVPNNYRGSAVCVTVSAVSACFS